MKLSYLLAACVAASSLTGSAWAQATATTSPPRDDRRSVQTPAAAAWRASQIIGATVRDRLGETLGQVQDLIFNPSTGQADFAVVSLSVPPHQGQLTAIPWPLVQWSGTPKQLTLSIDRNRVATAQTFDPANWPDFSQPGYSQRLYSYYGLNYERPAIGGRVPSTYYEYGTYERRREPAFPRPQPDGRQVFPQLNKENKEP